MISIGFLWSEIPTGLGGPKFHHMLRLPRKVTGDIMPWKVTLPFVTQIAWSVRVSKVERAGSSTHGVVAFRLYKGQCVDMPPNNDSESCVVGWRDVQKTCFLWQGYLQNGSDDMYHGVSCQESICPGSVFECTQLFPDYPCTCPPRCFVDIRQQVWCMGSEYATLNGTEITSQITFPENNHISHQLETKRIFWPHHPVSQQASVEAKALSATSWTGWP